MERELSNLIARLKEKAATKRDRLLEKARDEIAAQYTEDIRSIDRLASLDGEEDAGASTVKADDQNADESPRVRQTPKGSRLNLRIERLRLKDRIGPSAATREAIASFPTDFFTVRDVDAAIQRLHPHANISRVAISSALNKLVKQREIEVKEKSQGREPGTYRRLKKESQPTLLGEE